jgi:hypothetical protein
MQSANCKIVQTAQMENPRHRVAFDDAATQLQVFLNSFAAYPN